MGFWDDVGDAVSSAGDAVGDAVEGAVDGVTSAVGDTVDTVIDGVQDGLGIANGWLCRNAGEVGCRIGNVVLGGTSGLLEGAQDIADKGIEAVHDLGGAAGALLRGDIPGFLGNLGNVVLDAAEGLIDYGRFLAGGTVVAGIVDAWQVEDLRNFVSGLVNEHFADDSQLLGRIRRRLGLDDATWGLPFNAEHRVFRLDSATAPLWQWHRDGTIDLYAMAGLTSFDSFDVARKRTLVRSANADGTIESSLPINRWTLGHYIDSEGKDGRIRVYALDSGAVADFIRVATKKFKKLGINLDWNDGGRFDWFASDAVHDISSLVELTFDRNTLGQYLIDSGLRKPGADQCTLLALAAFNLVEGLGQTSGRNILEGDQSHPCATSPDRNDNCCVSVETTTGSGVIYHDQWPQNIFRYVLAHECGHYVGLCHYGHDGFQNIMFSPENDAHLSYFDWGLFRYYLDSEPTFTLDDAKNAWRFLVTQLAACLDEPGSVIE
jgi:hypothetical protein